MKTKTRMMMVALALLMVGGAAMALTQEDYDATFTEEQDYAGTKNYDAGKFCRKPEA